MKISKTAASGITKGSYAAIAACLAGSVYFAKESPEEKRVQEIREERSLASQEVMQCVPREKFASLSDKCGSLVQRYDSLGREAEALRHSTEYLLVQEHKDYSLYAPLLAGLFTVTSFLGKRAYVRRVNEEKEKKLIPEGEINKYFKR